MSRRLVAAAALGGIALCAQAQTFSACGSLDNAYGPFDYRRDRDKLPIVDVNHFTVSVENLIKGVTGPLGSDIDYTLRAFPNHHRALMAAMKLGNKLKNEQPPGMHYPIDCYFERATRFVADDTVVRAIYAIYLREHNRRADAEAQLDAGARSAGENAFAHFNLGLQYAELQLYDKAAEQARTAQELGLERPQLIEILSKAGKWPQAAASAPAP